MPDGDRRFYIIPPEAGREIICVGKIDLAERFAIEFGEGTHIVDTLAAPYFPMVKKIENGEPVYLEFGGWDMVAHPELNLIEAVKKACPPMARAFLAKGCDPNATDPNGGTALIWAVARGDIDAVRLLIEAGASIDAADLNGMTALKMAQGKHRDDIAALLV
ncbi:MAG: ankyrin repeat domain-containing protein [Rhodospirillales bacterium]|nr:ankyrin repeat domain-containing protein [Rhodospirillales bacterium]